MGTCGSSRNKCQLDVLFCAAGRGDVGDTECRAVGVRVCMGVLGHVHFWAHLLWQTGYHSCEIQPVPYEIRGGRIWIDNPLGVLACVEAFRTRVSKIRELLLGYSAILGGPFCPSVQVHITDSRIAVFPSHQGGREGFADLTSL